jgi:hypothetical protein
MMDLRSIARALGGEISGRQVLAPGPRHGKRDRSLSVRLSATAPAGFIVFSHAGDDFATCRDHVSARLGLPADNWKRGPSAESERPGRRAPHVADDDGAKKIAAALDLWRPSEDPRGTPAESYLASRGLEIDDAVWMSAVRWNPEERALIALFRNIETNAMQAVQLLYFDRDGCPIVDVNVETGKTTKRRRFRGPVGGAAIKLDSDATVLGGLHVGEGVETCMAARRLGLRPCWALGSKGAIAAFPVLEGVECLTILAEPDAEREVDACASRWDAAGREALINRSLSGKDLNDAARMAR